jgi:hypothetical protein
MGVSAEKKQWVIPIIRHQGWGGGKGTMTSDDDGGGVHGRDYVINVSASAPCLVSPLSRSSFTYLLNEMFAAHVPTGK